MAGVSRWDPQTSTGLLTLQSPLLGFTCISVWDRVSAIHLLCDLGQMTPSRVWVSSLVEWGERVPPQRVVGGK